MSPTACGQLVPVQSPSRLRGGRKAVYNYPKSASTASRGKEALRSSRCSKLLSRAPRPDTTAACATASCATPRHTWTTSTASTITARWECPCAWSGPPQTTCAGPAALAGAGFRGAARGVVPAVCRRVAHSLHTAACRPIWSRTVPTVTESARGELDTLSRAPDTSVQARRAQCYCEHL